MSIPDASQQRTATSQEKDDKLQIKRGQYNRQHSLRGKILPQSGVWNSRPSHTAQLQLYYGNGTVLCKGVDPTSAMQNADDTLIHSSLVVLSQRAFIRRTLGHSLVRINMLDSGIKVDCTLVTVSSGSYNSDLAGC